MVQIVSPPKLRQATCNRCEAVMTYDRNEVRYFDRKDYTGDNERCHYIVCPCCTNSVIVGRGYYY